jgi:hypothetical protein
MMSPRVLALQRPSDQQAQGETASGADHALMIWINGISSAAGHHPREQRI